MDSQVLNSHHKARYRSIGHEIMRTKSNSSTESYNRSSPEYLQLGGTTPDNSNEKDCSTNKMQFSTQTKNDATSDEEDSQEDVDNEQHIVRPESNINEGVVETNDDLIDDEGISYDSQNVSVPYDYSLVEGHDYDIVYIVNPDDLIEASSDEEKDTSDCYNENEESFAPSTNPDMEPNPVVGMDEKNGMDEYFLKNKSFLETDGPVVNDVDEYFIKDTDKPFIVQNMQNVSSNNKKQNEELAHTDNAQINLSENFSNVTDIFANNDSKPEQKPKLELDDNIADVSMNESDLEVLPKIEEIKQYLLEDIPYTKCKSIQKSCSVPQTPMQNYLDIPDTKMCLSLEDISFDLTDLAFENEKVRPDSVNKGDYVPHTLTEEDINSFLIKTTDNNMVTKEDDDLNLQDMDIELPVESLIRPSEIMGRPLTSTPLPAPILDYCIEKSDKKSDIKAEVDDYVDVEMCNDSAVPVLEANNLNSLLEQFEATEKLNFKKQHGTNVEQKVVMNKTTLMNGMRIQDASIQLNKNKMRQIMMPSTTKNSVRSRSPVHSDHDYCSKKKRHSLPNLKGGQSLLKPEVLSSNSRILNSRHRSCKDKKIDYHLSSDEESDKNYTKNKKKLNRVEDSDIKKTIRHEKPLAQANCFKKSTTHSVSNDFKHKENNSVIIKNACKEGNLPSSHNSKNSIKLKIINKSEVILNNCDFKDSHKKQPVDKCASSVNTHYKDNKVTDVKIKCEKPMEVDRTKLKTINHLEKVNLKDEPHSKDDNFYTSLFSNKQDVQIPQPVQIKTEKSLFEVELDKIAKEAVKKESDVPLRKKKLNLQEYKLRKNGNSTNSSTSVSPESIFPDVPSPVIMDKTKPIKPSLSLNSKSTIEKIKVDEPKTVFDPIREASRKILHKMYTKQQKAEAKRKREEEIIMGKIPKIENFQLQPLISEAEMLKIVGMTAPQIQSKPIMLQPQQSPEFEEIILVSVGTNTDKDVFKQSLQPKIQSAKIDPQSLINFKIKKSDPVLKQNVFETGRKDKKVPSDEKPQVTKIDEERFKDIRATLKTVGKQVETKIPSNSLLASIQDVIMKKAPKEVNVHETKSTNLKIPKTTFRTEKIIIVRDYNKSTEHGENKTVLHLSKTRSRPETVSIKLQTDLISKVTIPDLPTKEKPRQSNGSSSMPVSSDGTTTKLKQRNTDDKNSRLKSEKTEIQADSKELRCRSKERYDAHRRSLSRTRRRRQSRSRSKSRRPYRPYRRPDSPHKRTRRSPYHKRRSPSPRRERHSISRSRTENRPRSPKRPNANFEKKIVEPMTPVSRKQTQSESSCSSSSSSSTSSSSSSSTSSSSSSVSSKSSKKSHSSQSPHRRVEPPNKKPCFNSEDRWNVTTKGNETALGSSGVHSNMGVKGATQNCPNNIWYPNYAARSEHAYVRPAWEGHWQGGRPPASWPYNRFTHCTPQYYHPTFNTPVEERRIVFVGRLEKDITKASLRNKFSKFGHVLEVKLHSKEDGSRYGFVTYMRARDAWSAVEAAGTFPQYDVGFGGRRAFCRQSYADLDGLEANYTESTFHGQGSMAARHTDDMSFEQMLLDMKKKLSQRKNEKKRPEEGRP